MTEKDEPDGKEEEFDPLRHLLDKVAEKKGEGGEKDNGDEKN